MSDDESFDKSYNENNNNEQNLIIENQPIKKVKIGKGSDTLHVLPVKLKEEKTAIKAPVDTFFESNIKNEDATKNEYINHFRGRLLNGKRYVIPENINLTYYELIKEKNENDYIINQTRNIKDYYIWKYDEKCGINEPMTNLKKVLENFDFLA